jgi:hypothetical protein
MRFPKRVTLLLSDRIALLFHVGERRRDAHVFLFPSAFSLRPVVPIDRSPVNMSRDISHRFPAGIRQEEAFARATDIQSHFHSHLDFGSLRSVLLERGGACIGVERVRCGATYGRICLIERKPSVTSLAHEKSARCAVHWPNGSPMTILLMRLMQLASQSRTREYERRDR